MKWTKIGLVFNSRDKVDWAVSHALQPTPILLDHCIRVFVGLRDEQGVSRVGYVDLDRNDPMRVLDYSKSPSLDIGQPGCFDDNGVVPSAVVQHQGRTYLYYAGYQISSKVRFTVYGGLAESFDGKTFVRRHQVPVFDRVDGELLFRVPHSVINEEGRWKAWYGAGSEFAPGRNKTLPSYQIKYIESPSMEGFSHPGSVAVQTVGDEYRIGRPFYFRRSDGGRYLFFGAGTEDLTYRLVYAVSDDGFIWDRKDDIEGMDPSATGWDSEMIGYPAIIQAGERVYLFFNGKNYGEDGFGVAELVEW